MKLATLKDGSRDGQLVVVSRDLMTAHYATGIANTLQQVLEDWNFFSPQLQDLYVALNQGKARHIFAFEAQQCLAPLPRSYLLAVADADTPLEAGATKNNFHRLNLAFSDALQAACAPLTCIDETLGLDFAAGLAVVSGAVPQSSTPAQALESVRMLMLASQTHHRGWQDQAAWLAQPNTSFSPVAVTLDELAWSGESAWANGRLNLTLHCRVNGRKLGLVSAHNAMTPSMGDLLAALSQGRSLHSGSIVCSGEVRHPEAEQGACSLATRRAREAAQHGSCQTPWLAPGDTLNIDMNGRDGHSVFGAIAQEVQTSSSGITRRFASQTP